MYRILIIFNHLDTNAAELYPAGQSGGLGKKTGYAAENMTYPTKTLLKYYFEGVDIDLV